MSPLLHRRRTRGILKVLLSLVTVLLICLGFAFLFVQFYPFPKQQLLAGRNYPQVTSLQSGKAGDPINVMILGSRTEIISDFEKANWKIPDPITLQTSTKIAADSIANLPYPTAPVSNLYLYGRTQDLAFEMPTNDVQNRGHIRLWDTHTKMYNQEVWLGSASYDHGIELSGTTHLPTHHISPDVDRERSQVVKSLRPFVASVHDVEFRQPDLFGTNGGGDWYYTDGMMAILTTHNPPLNAFQENTSVISLKQRLLQFVSPVLNLF